MSSLTEIIDCPVIIHPGFPKAGSTFLQTEFLYQVPKTLYIGIPLPRFPKEDTVDYKILNFFNDLKEFLFFIDEEKFNKVKDYKIKNLQDSLRDIIDSIGINNINQIIYTDKALTEISSETIVNRSKKVDRLTLLFKDPYFLFVIRRQDHFIESLYGGYIKNKNILHPFCKFKEFIENAYDQEINKISIKKSIKNQKNFLNIKSKKYLRISVGYNRTLELPKYNKVISYYENNFNKSRIQVLLFEDLISKERFELDRLPIKFNFDHIKNRNIQSTNPRPSTYRYFHLKLRNFFVFDIIFRIINKLYIDKILIKIFPILGRRKKFIWESEIRNNILELYKSGNIEILKKYNLDLKNKRYPL